MPIAIQATADRTGILYIAEGTVTGSQLLEACRSIRSLADTSNHWMYCFHDFTQVESLACSADDIRALAREEVRSLAPVFPKGFVVAVVTPKDYHFGLARMWQVYAEKTEWEIAVFRSRVEGERWMRDRVRLNFQAEVKLQSPTAVAGEESGQAEAASGHS